MRGAKQVWAPRTTGGRLVLTGLLALNIASGLLHLWAAMQWSWFQDDWLYIQRAASWPFLDYVFMNYNGHAMPLKFLLVWILTVLAPLEFAPAGAVLVALIIASGAMWTALLVKIFGLKPQLLVAAASLLFSPLLISPTLWWAAGIQTYSLQLGMAVALWGTFNYLRGGRRSSYWLSLAAFIVAVLAWEKALLIAIPVAFMALLLPGVDRTLRTTWARGRAIIAGYVVTGAVLTLLFLWITRAPVPGQADLSVPPLGMLVSFMLTAGFGLTAPALVGGPWAGIPGLTSVYPSIDMFREWLLASAAALIVAWGLICRRAGWAAISMVMVFAATSWGLVVGSARYDSLGEFSALDPRYSADVAVVVILGAAYLVTATRQESECGTAWRIPVPPGLPRAVPWMTVAATVIVTASSLATWSTMMKDLVPLSPRTWVDNLTATARSVGPVTVFDSNAPINVLYPYYYPAEGRVSAMLAPLDLPLEFDSPTVSLHAVDPDGRIVPARIDARSASAPGDAGECGFAVNGEQWTFIPMDGPLYAWNWGLRLSYFSQDPPSFEVRVADDGFTFDARAGIGDIEAVVVSDIDVVAIRTTNGVQACVPSVVVGLVEPREPE